MESLRFFWKVSEKNREARLLTQRKTSLTKLAFIKPAQSLWCLARVFGGRTSQEFPSMGSAEPILKQGPCWSMLQESGLIICNLVTKAKSWGVALEMRPPSWLGEASFTGADIALRKGQSLGKTNFRGNERRGINKQRGREGK